MNEDQTWPNELKGQVDDAHLTTDRANTPPPGLWNQIRAQIQPQPIADTKERQPMMNATTLPHSITTPSRSVSEKAPGGLRHYTSLAATIALVLAVAVGGWLAMSQMPGGGSDGRFAAIQGTPEVAQSQTCDVEPMTVDEVMEIVKNPYSVMGIEPWEIVVGIPGGASSELAEPMDNKIDLRMLGEEAPAPDQSSFSAASTVMNEFLACTQQGTISQIFRLMVPAEVQRIILSNYPVFRDESTVRAGVEELIVLPAHRIVLPGSTALEDSELVFQANPDVQSAKSYPLHNAQLYDGNELLLLGTRVTNRDGEVVFQNNATGAANPVGTLKTTDRIRVLMVQSRFNDQWYVLATIPE